MKIRDLKRQMAQTLRAHDPKDMLTESSRRALCGHLTDHREPARQQLINSTPAVTRPITRAKYAEHLLKEVRNAS